METNSFDAKNLFSKLPVCHETVMQIIPNDPREGFQCCNCKSILYFNENFEVVGCNIPYMKDTKIITIFYADGSVKGKLFNEAWRKQEIQSLGDALRELGQTFSKETYEALEKLKQAPEPPKPKLPTINEIMDQVKKARNERECNSIYEFVNKNIKNYPLEQVTFIMESIIERIDELKYKNTQNWAKKYL